MPRSSIRFLSSPVAHPPEAGAVNVESDLVVILAAFLCALICIVGLIAVARCVCLHHPTTSNNKASPSATTANKGLKKKILHSLPKFTYTNSSTNKFASSSDRATCLAEFVQRDEVRVLPQCRHGFHVACIDTWLASHSSCPSRRQILVLAQCQKCGQFPDMSSRSGEGQMNLTEGHCSNNNNNEATFLPSHSERIFID